MALNSPAEPSTLGQWLLATKAEGPTRIRQGRIAAVMLLATALLLIAGLISFAATRDFITSDPTTDARFLTIGSAAVLLVAAIYFINRRGNVLAAGLSLAVLLLGLNLALLSESGPLSPAAVALAVPVIIAGLLSPPIGVGLIALLAIVGYFLLCLSLPDYAISFFTNAAYLQSGLVYLNILFVAVMSWLLARTTQDAVEESSSLSVALTNQQHIVEQQLNQQTRYLRSTVQITRSLTGIRELDELMSKAVALVRETYDYYHVRLYLIDAEDEFAVLRQSQGDTGPLLMEGEYRHRVGGRSAVGRATGARRPYIIRDTRTQLSKEELDTVLPGSLSIAAFPLVLGSNVIGALEFQSTSRNDFPNEAVPTLQALCDQLSIAIENARLFQQTQDSLQELTQLGTEVNRLNWSEFLASSTESDIRQIYGTESKLLAQHRDRVVERVIADGVPIASTGNDGRQSFLAVPIVVRDEIVGVMGIEPSDSRNWTRDDVQLLERIAERTSLAVENARLYAQARRSAQRERLINQISARLQTAPSLELLLQATAQELAQVFGTDNVYTQITLGGASLPEQKSVKELDERTVDGTAHPTKKPDSAVSLDSTTWQQTPQEEQHD